MPNVRKRKHTGLFYCCIGKAGGWVRREMKKFFKHKNVVRKYVQRETDQKKA